MKKNKSNKANINKKSSSNKFKFKVSLKSDVFSQIIKYNNEHGCKSINIISDKHDSRHLFLGNIGCFESDTLSLREVIAQNELRKLLSYNLDALTEELLISFYSDDVEQVRFVISDLLLRMCLITDDQCLVTCSDAVLRNLFERDALITDANNLDICISMIKDEVTTENLIRSIATGVFPVIRLIPNYELGNYVPMISTITCCDGDCNLGIFNSATAISHTN